MKGKAKLFVVGTSETITSAAVTAILTGEGREDDDVEITKDEITSISNPILWSLQTRYYNKEIEIHHHSIIKDDDDADDCDSNSKRNTNRNKLSMSEMSEFSALVMACKCDSTIDFSIMKTFVEDNRVPLSNLIQAVDGEEVDATRILLVDGTEDIDSAEVNPFISTWCLMNNIEPVRVSLLSRNSDDILREVGDRLGDAQGVQRAVDALSATKWPGLVIKRETSTKSESMRANFKEEEEEEEDYDSDDDVDFLLRERKTKDNFDNNGTSSSGRRDNDDDIDHLSFLDSNNELMAKIESISERAQRNAQDLNDTDRRKAAFEAIEELISTFKDLDPLQDFNEFNPTTEEEMRREVDEAGRSFQRDDNGNSSRESSDDDIV